ncbi:hypothetical protein [Candidatus Nitrososphaera sp. FF02]|uniref:hypothetical protein n=1 Tax=Candidatus Nitrososphaera sp. FF02 TaxID=3398226 RepID=UPI0039E9937B
MVLQSEIVSALTYATSKGYQIHPDAFAMLKGLEGDLLKAVQDIIKQKKQTKMIFVEDIKGLLAPAQVQDAPAEQKASRARRPDAQGQHRRGRRRLCLALQEPL